VLVLVLVLVLLLVLLLVPLLLLLQPCVDIGGGKWVGDCVCLSWDDWDGAEGGLCHRPPALQQPAAQ